jgi:hypothetical protein
MYYIRSSSFKKNISPLRLPITCFTVRGCHCAPRPRFAPPTCLPLHRTFRWPSSLPPRAHTATACSPRPHTRCRLAARGCTYPIADVGSTAGSNHLGHCTRPVARGSAAAPRCHPPSPPRPHSQILLCSVVTP